MAGHAIFRVFGAAGLFFGAWLIPFSAQAEERPNLQPPDAGLSQVVDELLQQYCSDCHQGQEADGGVSLDELDARIGDGHDLERWRMIYDRVKYLGMPPQGAPPPSVAERKQILDGLRHELRKTQLPGGYLESNLKQPQYGNYVNHAELFGRPGYLRDVDEVAVIPGLPRLWRLRPRSYEWRFLGKPALRERHGLSEPFSLVATHGFRDFASQYFVDEPATELLLANVEKLAPLRSAETLQALTSSDAEQNAAAVESSVRETFLLVLQREPATAESDRLARFHRRMLTQFGTRVAAERLLAAIYLQPEALFREEFGEGPPDELGRVRLSQREIALSISYTLGERPDDRLLAAAASSELATREQVLAQVLQRLESPPQPDGNPRLLQFFREFFGYEHAREVFKNQPKRGIHRPEMLVADLDLLIESIVKQDRDVLARLLTTNEYFVDCRRDADSEDLIQHSAARENVTSDSGHDAEYALVYGLPRDWFWTNEQPIAMPSHMRAGVLTHPAWLAAWSGNFDNQPVQRGRWIRTRLLGGTVPDLPIGVDVTLPEDHSKQFRERIESATSRHECQRCHRKMDALGFPFEQFDHYGHFRIHEAGRAVDTSGMIADVDEAAISGRVENPLELVHRLARSQLVEQVFVRHAFRFFLGRNETLGDATTLQNAHRAYRDHGGSFRWLVASLLTSDSFLLRRGGTE